MVNSTPSVGSRAYGPVDGRGEAQDVIEQLRRLHLSTEALFDAMASHYDINRTDLRCLEILNRDGSMSARSLAEHSALSPAAITKVADRLAAAGYITQKADPADRRAHILSVSPDFLGMRSARWKPVADATDRVLKSLTADERDKLVRVLSELAESTREVADGTRGTTGD